jgi:ubiquinone/menaquinone biosynthesis C-methylase UbiE
MNLATFTLGDAAHLPFVDRSFDFTSISLALHDKEGMLMDMIVSEMKRVTRPGGALVFLDYSVPLPISISGYFIRLIEYFAGPLHFGNFISYLKNGGLQQVLDKHGLSVVKTTHVKSGNITLVLAQDTRFIQFAPQ